MAFIKGLQERVQGFIEGLSGGARMLLLVGLAAAGTVAVLWFVWGGDSYQVLYSNLSEQDAGAIVAKLKEKKVPFEISGGGSAVMVPQNQVYEMRLTLASEGLPKGGSVGFEIFNEQSLGTTEFVQKLNYQRALQGELVRTISGFSEVEDARVHIVMPKESVFLDEQEPAHAAVVLKVRSGRTLTGQQVQGIVHLVASSVEGLSPQNVTVVDMSGRALYSQEQDGQGGQLSSSQLEYQKNLEDGFKHKIEGILEKVAGPGKAIARVSADLDFTQQSITQETFDPDSAVARTKQTSLETTGGGSGAVMGIPGPDYDANQPQPGQTARAGGGGVQRQTENVSYEINKIAKQVVSPIGAVKRLSVAVIIDGVYKEGKDGERSFIPRTKQELLSFEGIVKKAVGFDENRGDQVEVTSIPFALPDAGMEPAGAFSDLPAKVLNAGTMKGLAKAVMALLLIFFVLRPIASGLSGHGTVGVGAGKARLPGGAQRLELGMPQAAGEIGVRDQAMLLARSDPEKTAELIRSWLAKKE